MKFIIECSGEDRERFIAWIKTMDQVFRLVCEKQEMHSAWTCYFEIDAATFVDPQKVVDAFINDEAPAHAALAGAPAAPKGFQDETSCAFRAVTRARDSGMSNPRAERTDYGYVAKVYDTANEKHLTLRVDGSWA